MSTQPVLIMLPFFTDVYKRNEEAPRTNESGEEELGGGVPVAFLLKKEELQLREHVMSSHQSDPGGAQLCAKH